MREHGSAEHWAWRGRHRSGNCGRFQLYLKDLRTVFRLLIDCFPDYAEGYNYLGLIALRRDDLKKAESHFARILDLLRPRLPRRMTPRIFGSHIRFRLYRRATNNLALVFTRTGRYDRALELCEKLESECGADIDAAELRAAIYLNQGAWNEAAKAALYTHKIAPSGSLVAALALFELGRIDDAVSLFLHGSLNHPAAAAMLAGRRWPAPKDRHEWEDHQCGASFRKDLHEYYSKQSPKARRFFKRLSASPEVAALLGEIDKARSSRPADGNRDPFRKWQSTLTPEFARKRAMQLTHSLLP